MRSIPRIEWQMLVMKAIGLRSTIWVSLMSSETRAVLPVVPRDGEPQVLH